MCPDNFNFFMGRANNVTDLFVLSDDFVLVSDLQDASDKVKSASQI